MANRKAISKYIRSHLCFLIWWAWGSPYQSENALCRDREIEWPRSENCQNSLNIISSFTPRSQLNRLLMELSCCVWVWIKDDENAAVREVTRCRTPCHSRAGSRKGFRLSIWGLSWMTDAVMEGMLNNYLNSIWFFSFSPASSQPPLSTESIHDK